MSRCRLAFSFIAAAAAIFPVAVSAAPPPTCSTVCGSPKSCATPCLLNGQSKTCYEFGSCFAPEGDIFVSVTGDDSSSGRWGTPLRTIQRCVDLVSPEQTCRVRAGTYAGFDVRKNDVKVVRYLDDVVTLERKLPAKCASMPPEKQCPFFPPPAPPEFCYPVVTVNDIVPDSLASIRNVVIDGFRIDDVQAGIPPYEFNAFWGCVSVRNSSNVTVRNMNIASCNAHAGIHVYTGSDVTLEKNSVSYARRVGITVRRISRGAVRDNMAFHNGWDWWDCVKANDQGPASFPTNGKWVQEFGHGLWLIGSNHVTVERNEWIQNMGNGVDMENEGGTGRTDYNILRGNALVDNGMGFWVNGSHALVEDNTVTGGYGCIFTTESAEDEIYEDITMRRNLCVANNAPNPWLKYAESSTSSDLHGAPAIYIRAGKDVRILNNTLVDNGFPRHTEYGGGIMLGDLNPHVWLSGTLEVTNNIVINDAGREFRLQANQMQPGTVVRADYNLFYDPPSSEETDTCLVQWEDDCYVTIPSSMGHTISADPLLEHSTYRLRPGSPAIDAGICVGPPYAGAAPDLGAFEVGTPNHECPNSLR